MARGTEHYIDTSTYKFYFDGCEQSIDTQTGEIRTTADGVNKWIAFVLRKEENRQGSKSIKLHIASKQNPCSGLSELQPVAVKRMKYQNSFGKDGNFIEWYTAESIVKA